MLESCEVKNFANGNAAKKWRVGCLVSCSVEILFALNCVLF